MSGIGLCLIFQLSLLSSILHIPAASMCYFEKLNKISDVMFVCDSPTAQEIILQMELFFNKEKNITVGMWSMSESNIRELDEKTFQYKELTGINFLFLDGNQISNLPENLFNSQALKSLEYLYLERNKISYLSSKQFHYLENLKLLNLSFNELNEFGNLDVFTSIPSSSLEHIDLSHNKVSLLPQGLFEGKTLSSLVKLFLQNNNISEIPRSVFTSNFLKNLTDVRLDHNFIHEIPAASPLSESTLIKLTELNLEFNQLETISVDLFHSRNWASLKRLRLSHNNISSLPNYMFSSRFLHNLEHISVTDSLIEALPGNLFHKSYLIHLNYLDFSHNRIKTLHQNLLNPVREGELIVIPRGCSDHSPCITLQNLAHLDISFNKIRHIPYMFFRHLRNLKVIKLNNNRINKISVNCFPDSLEHLQILDLSGNLINTPMTDIFTLILSSREVIPLLNVSHNQISVQENFILGQSPLFEMLHLDMSYNNISKFDTRGLIVSSMLYRKVTNLFHIDVAFKILLNKIWANVEGNQIFSVNNLVKATFGLELHDSGWLGAVKNLTHGLVIRLHSFIKTFPYSYHCNCDMVNYLRLQHTKYFRQSLRLYQTLLKTHRSSILRKYGYVASNNDFNNLLCGAPVELAGKYLFELLPSELQCHDSRCTESIKCSCSYTPANYTVKINCTGSSLKYAPSITIKSSNLEIYLGFNNLSMFPAISLHISRKTILLDLSYNSISSIPNEFFTDYPKIRKLNLAGNLLMNLPSIPKWNNLNSLNFLELQENHFICNCSGLSLKKTLMSINKRVTLSDINKITCYLPKKTKNMVIYDSPDSLFGCPFVNLTLILILVFVFLLFIVILAFIAYVFRYYIRLFLFIHFGLKFFYSYPKEESLYDVFVSYCHKDSDWVEEHLMNPLEGLDPPYNLCLHERDFQVGIPICDNITRAIEGSRCTLVVVSRNWLQSDWCQFEFRVAHCLATVEKQSRLIVVLQEKIPPEEIKGDLELYIKTFTYLDSANKLFWPRLLTDLPNPYIEETGNQHDQHRNTANIELLHV